MHKIQYMYVYFKHASQWKKQIWGEHKLQGMSNSEGFGTGQSEACSEWKRWAYRRKKVCQLYNPHITLQHKEGHSSGIEQFTRVGFKLSSLHTVHFLCMGKDHEMLTETKHLGGKNNLFLSVRGNEILLKCLTRVHASKSLELNGVRSFKEVKNTFGSDFPCSLHILGGKKKKAVKGYDSDLAENLAVVHSS